MFGTKKEKRLPVYKLQQQYMSREMANGNLKLVLQVSLACLCAAAEHVNHKDLHGTLSSSYPNPSKARFRCKSRKGRLCDPDAVLEDADRDQVDLYLQHDRPLAVASSCLGQTNGEVRQVNAQVAVALVKKMRLDSELNKLAAAERFARSIHDSWGVGHRTRNCGDTGVLLFLSDLDRTIQISRGQAVERTLTNRRIDRIIGKMKPLLRKNEYGSAISTALHDIDAFLAQGEPGMIEIFVDWVVIHGGWLFLLGLIFLSSQSRERKRRQEYCRVRGFLSEIDQQRAEALQGTFRARSCPICLEDFLPKDSDKKDSLLGSDGQPVKLLRCGHVFDDSCWSKWVLNARGDQFKRCPICRENIEHSDSRATSETDDITPGTESRDEPGPNETTNTGGPRGSSSSYQLFLSERTFRLNRLASMYPRYVTRDMIRLASSSDYDGQLTQEAFFLEQDPSHTQSITGSSEDTEQHSFDGGLDYDFGGGASSSAHGDTW